jgi:inhibitor of cysteine peptidase
MKKIVIALMACIGLAACASAEKIELKPEEKTFSIRLNANPTTGFMWQVAKLDPSYFHLEKKYFEKQRDQSLVGAPQTRVFVFSVLKPPHNAQKIILKYGRPWEKEPDKSVTYTIEVIK